MNREILIAEKIKDSYEGDPWYGRNIKSILGEVSEDAAFQKPSGQHSILELLWHMITWKEFTVSRLREDKGLAYYDANDWRELDHSDRTLWQKGMQRYREVHNELVEVIQQQTDEILSQTVSEKPYHFRKLLYGVLEHDVYHLGQIAYIKKMLAKG